MMVSIPFDTYKYRYISIPLTSLFNSNLNLRYTPHKPVIKAEPAKVDEAKPAMQILPFIHIEAISDAVDFLALYLIYPQLFKNLEDWFTLNFLKNVKYVQFSQKWQFFFEISANI